MYAIDPLESRESPPFARKSHAIHIADLPTGDKSKEVALAPRQALPLALAGSLMPSAAPTLPLYSVP